ncbi:MAG: hypothetical protein ACRDE7_05845, partial [Sphingobacterium sp.]
MKKQAHYFFDLANLLIIHHEVSQFFLQNLKPNQIYKHASLSKDLRFFCFSAIFDTGFRGIL